MKKRIICLALLLVMALSLTSCIVSDDRYDYNMEKYVSLVNYDGYKVEIELDSIQAAIDSYLMDDSTEYVVQVGDDIYVDVVAYKVNNITTDAGTSIDQQGDEIKELKKEGFLLSNVGSGSYGSQIENSLLGATVEGIRSP